MKRKTIFLSGSVRTPIDISKITVFFRNYYTGLLVFLRKTQAFFQAGQVTIDDQINSGKGEKKRRQQQARVTFHRTTKDFKLKSDTLAVIKISGSQNANDVRRQFKEVLQKYGYDESWRINMTTDGASVMKSARAGRAPGRHPQVFC